MSWSETWGTGRIIKARTVVLEERDPDGDFPSDRADFAIGTRLGGSGGDPDVQNGRDADDSGAGDGAEATGPDAEALLAAAREEARALREEARAEGYREGRTTGYREGLEQARGEIGTLVAEAQSEARDLREASVRSLGHLACELASHLLGVAVTLDPDLVEEATLALLEEARPLGVISISVAPSDLEPARRARVRWQGDLGGELEIAVVPDPTLPGGAVRVETRSGALERVWPERLAEMDRAMEEVAKDLVGEEEI